MVRYSIPIPTNASERANMETLKVAAFAAVITILLIVAAIIGQSKLPKSDLCEINYRLDGTWEPVGWKVEEGFPRNDCRFPADRFTEEDGTWDWK